MPSGVGGKVMDRRDCVEMLELLFDEYDEMDRLNPSVLFRNRYSEIVELMLKGGN